MDWPFADQLPPDARAALDEASRERRYRKGDTLFHEGDSGDTLYLLVSGRLAVRVTTPAGDRAMLTVLAPGSVFGEMAIVQDEHVRTASIVALEVVTTRTLRRRELDPLRAIHRSLDGLLIEILAERVDRLSKAVVDLRFEGVGRRLARQLLVLAEIYADNGQPVRVPLTQDELAELVGTTRPTLNQSLQRLVSDGVVRLGRGTVELVDLAALRRKAGQL